MEIIKKYWLVILAVTAFIFRKKIKRQFKTRKRRYKNRKY